VNAPLASLTATRAREVPRLALTVTEAAEAIGVSPDFFAEHVAGELRIVRRGRKKLVSVRELETWLDRNAARVFFDEETSVNARVRATGEGAKSPANKRVRASCAPVTRG